LLLLDVDIFAWRSVITSFSAAAISTTAIDGRMNDRHGSKPVVSNKEF